MTYTPYPLWYVKIAVGMVFLCGGMFMMLWPLHNAHNNDGWMIVSGGTAAWIGCLWFL